MNKTDILCATASLAVCSTVLYAMFQRDDALVISASYIGLVIGFLISGVAVWRAK